MNCKVEHLLGCLDIWASQRPKGLALSSLLSDRPPAQLPTPLIPLSVRLATPHPVLNLTGFTSFQPVKLLRQTHYILLQNQRLPHPLITISMTADSPGGSLRSCLQLHEAPHSMSHPPPPPLRLWVYVTHKMLSIASVQGQVLCVWPHRLGWGTPSLPNGRNKRWSE